MQTGIVYCHINKLSGKVYVGQTWHQEWRWMPSAYRACVYFANAIQKYGWNNFDHLILRNDLKTQIEMDNLERIYQILFQARNTKCGYNIREGGSHGKLSNETRRKISEAHRGLPAHNKGKSISEETRQKLIGNKNSVGVKISTEHRRKLAECAKVRFKGKPWSVARRAAYQAALAEKARIQCV